MGADEHALCCVFFFSLLTPLRFLIVLLNTEVLLGF